MCASHAAARDACSGGRGHAGKEVLLIKRQRKSLMRGYHLCHATDERTRARAHDVLCLKIARRYFAKECFAQRGRPRVMRQRVPRREAARRERADTPRRHDADSESHDARAALRENMRACRFLLMFVIDYIIYFHYDFMIWLVLMFT